MESHGVLKMPPEISAEDFIGAGTSGICFRYPGTMKVIKIPLTNEEEGDRCRVEIKAYERMQKRPGRPTSILSYYGENEYGIDLAYASHGSIRQYRANGGIIPKELQYRWAEQASEALVFCHECNILHADINCGNFFVDENFNLMLADFAGSSIDSKRPLVSYSSSHRRPNGNDDAFVTTEQTEVFAFGCFLYEMVAGQEPCLRDGLSKCCSDASGLRLGHVITGCLTDKFRNMKEVRCRIKEENFFGSSNTRRQSNPSTRPYIPTWKASLLVAVTCTVALSFWHRFGRR